MKKNTRNKINLVFSSFLVIGYIICTFFFSTLANQAAGTVGSLIQVLILVLFGLLLFYATRVGEGKQVKRFSLAVLLLMVLPCAYIILASFIPFLPFNGQLATVTYDTGSGAVMRFQPVIQMLACVGLGYGIPYTFLSGYELKTDEAEAEEAAGEYKPLEGGLAEELAETEAEAEAEEAAAEEAVEEAAEAAETTGEAAEEKTADADKTEE